MQREKSAERAAVVASGDGEAIDFSTALDELKERERSIILSALEKSDGKVSGRGGAAELLGLRPTTLESKLKAMGWARGSAKTKR